MSDIVSELQWRGLVHQTTDEAGLRKWLDTTGRAVYAGFDPTAESLHVGSLLPLMTLRRFQKAGHKPVALVGGATGMIGDPSGKSQERNLLDSDQLDRNVAGMASQMRNFLDFECADRSAVLVNNYDWMNGFSYLNFLRDVGKNFPVNVMLAKDSVKSRIGRDDGGISYTEFSYMLLQAYDFVHLSEQYDCRVQIGGSDQWGNITAGIDLGRRMRSVQLFGLTCPLLLTSDGRKMGKTESGAIWLSPERTSPYAFYQYWINVADADTGNCLRFLTELKQEEIIALDKSREEEPHKNESQKRLAIELTRLVHGEAGLAKAQRASAVLFSGGEIENLTDKELNEIFPEVPCGEETRSALAGEGVSLIDALVATGQCKSKGEARKAIQQGGVYVNNHRREDIDTKLSPADLASETIIVLRRGKKNYALLRIPADA
ncbi:MAG: tyrosyl-tRNA synthetase [Pirellulaceae bacterium]